MRPYRSHTALTGSLVEDKMITLTRLNGQPIVINALLIESIEQIPDTMITLTTGKKITVLEQSADVIRKTADYVRDIGGLSASIKSLDSEGQRNEK